MAKRKIDGKTVKRLRTASDMKQQTLAEAVGVDSGTISRIERGEIKSVRPETFEKLQKVLEAEEAELRGARVIPANKSAMQLGIDEACRNALMLVARRYDVPLHQIIEVAPLLFFIAAEQSLKGRMQLLSEQRQKLEALREGPLSHLATLGLDDLRPEERSIGKRDLAGSDANAFGEFLTASLKQLVDSAKPVVWDNAGPRYEICEDEAAAMVGGNSEAAAAILSGEAALRKVPAAVRKSACSELAEWIIKLRKVALSEVDDVVTPFEPLPIILTDEDL